MITLFFTKTMITSSCIDKKLSKKFRHSIRFVEQLMIRMIMLVFTTGQVYNGPRVVKFISAVRKKILVKNDIWTKK